MNIQTKPILFLDFDGTISCRDAIDAILEKFADKAWETIEADWKRGAIGSRECLREQVALVNASPDEVNELLDEIKLDAGFESLIKVCQRFGVEPHIISDGFDFCITRILSGSVTAVNLPVFSSHLEFEDGKWKTGFQFFAKNCQHGCATCKPQVMKMLNKNEAPMIFVGDGLSDRYAAQTADLVFAKKSLATYCSEKNIRYLSYQNLFDVSEKLEKILTLQNIAARSPISWVEFIKAQKIYN